MLNFPYSLKKPQTTKQTNKNKALSPLQANLEAHLFFFNARYLNKNRQPQPTWPPYCAASDPLILQWDTNDTVLLELQEMDLTAELLSSPSSWLFYTTRSSWYSDYLLWYLINVYICVRQRERVCVSSSLSEGCEHIFISPHSSLISVYHKGGHWQECIAHVSIKDAENLRNTFLPSHFNGLVIVSQRDVL